MSQRAEVNIVPYMSETQYIYPTMTRLVLPGGAGPAASAGGARVVQRGGAEPRHLGLDPWRRCVQVL